MKFRVKYIRDGKPRGMTFAKRNLALATLFYYEHIIPLIKSIGGKDIQPPEAL
jgi:hypothetical protein